MVYNSLELTLEAITNTITMLEKENKAENKEKIEELKKERKKLLEELKVFYINFFFSIQSIQGVD